MNFKDQAALDALTFTNPDEFGSLHDIDGRQVLITIDNDELRERKSNASNPTDGVYSASLLFYARLVDFPEPPVVEERLKLDGTNYTVASVDLDAVMLTVTLRRYRS